MEEIQLTSEKSFQIGLRTDKSNSYSVTFNLLTNSIEIISNQINGIIQKEFSSKYSFEEIRENKYFLQFDTLSDILDEIKERMYNNQIIIQENENSLFINVPLLSSKNKEIIFELKQITKNNNERFNELTSLITKLTKEMAQLREEVKNLNDENKILKTEINNMGNEESKPINENTQIINDINRLKNEHFKLKNEVIELKEKLNVLLLKEENELIGNIDSKIINTNYNYVMSLKKWINCSKKIKTNLLYRLSENGDKYSTFHSLCGHKKPTLTLFHVNDGNIVGIYTPLSWDTSGKWKNDMETFIFNLNKNKRYKKLKPDNSIFCNSSCGPWTAFFGCSVDKSMKSIKHLANYIDSIYHKGSNILPSDNQEKDYELLEAEVFEIKIE